MSFSRILLAASTAVLLAGTAAYAADPAPAPAPLQNDGHGMMRGMFTPEERMMLMADAFKAMAGMTDDQRHLPPPNRPTSRPRSTRSAPRARPMAAVTASNGAASNPVG